MHTKAILAIAAMTMFCGACAGAAALFTDNFETYNQGTLASTDTNTANPGPNGGPGNPWWAPPSSNGVVTTAINGVTPHSGTQMVKGAAPADFDQNVVNIAYRAGGGAPITGNVALDFYFYDTNGAGDANNTGYAEMGYYSGLPNNTDYAAGHGLGFDGATIQRIVLGMVGNNGGDTSVYQVRVIAGTVSKGTGYANTYINTTTPRTAGWHEGRVVIGPQLTSGGNLVDFYVDDMTTPDAEATTTLGNGYNALILDTQIAGTATTINYFDDVTLSSTPEPTCMVGLAVGAFLLSARRRRTVAA